ESIAADSQAGFNSAIFVRTVKLKDFPWNGWLRLGIATKPAAAWNPIGGLGDPAGRLIWSAVGDPAMIPEPYAAGWVANRVAPGPVAREPDIAVPEDALRPEPGTGTLREVGKGQTARERHQSHVVGTAVNRHQRPTTA